MPYENKLGLEAGIVVRLMLRETIVGISHIAGQITTSWAEMIRYKLHRTTFIPAQRKISTI